MNDIERTYVRDVKNHVNEDVLLKGFVHTIRRKGGIIFLVLRDISGTMQTIAFKSNPELFEQLKSLTPESSIELQGKVTESAQAPNGVELQIQNMNILTKSQPDLPIPVYERGNDSVAKVVARHSNRFLDLRKPKNALVMKLTSSFNRYYREFLLDRNFLEIHTPKLMPTPSESSSQLFEVKYFGRKAYLAQSPQLYKQMAIASGLERVFEIGPIFRAEESFTPRHGTEVTSCDIECAFIKDYSDIMKLEENLLAYIFRGIKKDHGDEIKSLYGIDLKVPQTPFPKIPLRGAKALINSQNPAGDLSADEEKAIGKFFQERGHDFVFVTEYPIDVRPFYHKRFSDKPYTKSADLLYKGLEITTLAQREENYEKLVAQVHDKHLRQEGLQWYLDFFKYGTPPHGGCGIGSARIIMQLLNLPNIREAMFIERNPGRMRC